MAIQAYQGGSKFFSSDDIINGYASLSIIQSPFACYYSPASNLFKITKQLKTFNHEIKGQNYTRVIY